MRYILRKKNKFCGWNYYKLLGKGEIRDVFRVFVYGNRVGTWEAGGKGVGGVRCVSNSFVFVV